jgi:uracil-DNA glycosylase family 4
MLVGEALGGNEEKVGRPFVGDAGRKLNYCLAKAGLPRNKLLIGNSVRCRPPGNAKPGVVSLSACWPYLWYDILKYKPKVIVALGATAFLQLTGQSGNFTSTGRIKYAARKLDKYRGFPEQHTYSWTTPKGKEIKHTCWVVPAYHPSACLHAWELDDLLIFDLGIAKALAKGEEPLTWPNTKVEVVKTMGQFQRLCGRLRRVASFVFDLETTGLSPHEHHIRCIGFCYRDGHAVVLPLLDEKGKQVWPVMQRRIILQELTDIFQYAKLIGQNLKFDLQHTRKLTGIVDYNVAGDTMIMHHAIDENKPHNLTFLCQYYLRWKKYDELVESFRRQVGKDKEVFARIPDQSLWTYCGYDVDGTHRLVPILRDEIKRQGVETAYRNSLGIVVPIADMEFRGIQADRTKLEVMSEVYAEEGAAIEAKLQALANEYLGVVTDKQGRLKPFNPRSGVQLAALLEAVGATLRKKTKSGKAAVDKRVLSALTLGDDLAGEVAKDIRKLRTITKNIGTYLAGKGEEEGGWLRFMGEHDRWHPSYNLSRARTGRLSADDPAIQTLPRDYELRSMVIPDQPRCKIIEADYSKLELCVMAWLAGDRVMAKELRAGVDLHTNMAVTARLMRIPTVEEIERIGPEIGKNERAVAKGVNFGVPYGMGAPTIVESNPEAFPEGMYYQERVRLAQRVIDAYLDKYRAIALYRQDQVEQALTAGVLVTNIFRRRRRLTGVEWFNSKWGRKTHHRAVDLGHLEREALNFEIQSIANDTLTKATRIVWRGMKKVRIPCFRMILTLHDALIFSCHEDYTEEASFHIRRWMETTLPKDKDHPFAMPLKVDVGVHEYFGQEYAPKEQ